MPTQIILQPGSRIVAASQQKLRGASGGAVNQPHSQLQDGRVGYRRSRGGQVSPTELSALYRKRALFSAVKYLSAALSLE